MWEARRQPAVFVGRRDEVGAITDRIRDAGDHRSTVVWVEGEAGWGKTALVRRVVADLPEGTTTLWAEGDDLASDVAFGLARQLGPVDDPDPFTAGMALLDHLGAHAGEREGDGPVVVVVEDLHWADQPSRLALLTVARRLGPDRVVLLVTSRPHPGASDGWDRLVNDDGRCLTVRLGPLSPEDVLEWADRAGTELSAPQAERLHDHTGGHPLYVHTLLGELTIEQLRSTDTDLPAPRSLAQTTIGALGGLPRDAQVLAAAMAVAGTRAPLAEVGRVAGIDDPTAALEALLGTGVVRWWPGDPSTPVDFAHPLYRTAVYDDLAPTRRQELHLAMAQHVGQVEGWAHRVAAAVASDDALADELDEGAAAAIARGEVVGAIRYLLWAAPLTADTPRAEDRLLRAAHLLARQHQIDRLEDLLPRVRACAPGGRRDLVLGMHAAARGDLLAAERLLLAAAEAEADVPALRAEALAQLGGVYVNLARFDAAGGAAAEALAIEAGDDAVTRAAWGARALAEANARGTRAGLSVLGDRLPRAASAVAGADADLLLARAMMALHLDGDGVIDDLHASIDLLRRGFGGATQLARAHVVLAEALERSGEWDEALRHARAAHELSELSGASWHAGRPEAVVGIVAAARGELDEARRQLAAADEAVRAIGSPWTTMAAARLAAAIATVDGDAEAAADVLLPLADDPDPSVAHVLFATWWPPLVAALVAAGRLDDAAGHLDRLDARAAALDVPLVGVLQGLRARLAAAHGDLEAASECFAAALAPEHARANDFALDRALLHHERGRALRGRKQRREATDELRTAHDVLAGLGAEPFLAGVADDLAATGVRGPSASPRSSLSFTDREQDVVALARRNLTNREIARELYVSEKAVEYHLRNVYGKVGVRSRRELLALDQLR